MNAAARVLSNFVGLYPSDAGLQLFTRKWETQQQPTGWLGRSPTTCKLREKRSIDQWEAETTDFSEIFDLH